MENKIKKILIRIAELDEALRKEYSKISQKYGFSIKRKRIIFLEKIKRRNRKFRIPAWKYALPKNIRHLLSIPFIYAMIIPVILLDFFVTIYHWVAFPLYKIPKVQRSDYIIYDRRFLDYLNIIQKINCLYCSYVNGIFTYSVEIAKRTERYWCPIKSARKPKLPYNWDQDFADYGNPQEWNQKFNQVEGFKKKQKTK